MLIFKLVGIVHLFFALYTVFTYIFYKCFNKILSNEGWFKTFAQHCIDTGFVS